MSGALGILLIVAGAALVFAVERETDGVDLHLMGWMLMAGGGAMLLAVLFRASALGSVTHADHPADADHGG